MIKQDYLVRMIQEIISLIFTALMKKKRYSEREWDEYDSLSRQIVGFDASELPTYSTEDIVGMYDDDPDRFGKIELVAMLMLKMSDETEDDFLLKSQLKQNGIALLHYVDKEGPTVSLQRTMLLNMLELNK